VVWVDNKKETMPILWHDIDGWGEKKEEKKKKKENKNL
jgi:hypothetical protein